MYATFFNNMVDMNADTGMRANNYTVIGRTTSWGNSAKMNFASIVAFNNLTKDIGVCQSWKKK